MSRFPLSEVVFNQPTAIPGCSVMLTSVTPMEARLPGGEHFTCPQPFFDEEIQRVIIEGREYPLSRIHYFVRAKMAKSVPETVDYEQFTVGKRPPRRIKISVEERTDLGPVKRGPKD